MPLTDTSAVVKRGRDTMTELQSEGWLDAGEVVEALCARVEALEGEGAQEFKEIARLIMSNIEEEPGWSGSVPLITAHCHAYVLLHDWIGHAKPLPAPPERTPT